MIYFFMLLKISPWGRLLFFLVIGLMRRDLVVGWLKHAGMALCLARHVFFPSIRTGFVCLTLGIFPIWFSGGLICLHLVWILSVSVWDKLSFFRRHKAWLLVLLSAW